MGIGCGSESLGLHRAAPATVLCEFSCCFRLISRTISPFEPTFRIMVLNCLADCDGIGNLDEIIPVLTPNLLIRSYLRLCLSCIQRPFCLQSGKYGDENAYCVHFFHSFYSGCTLDTRGRRLDCWENNWYGPIEHCETLVLKYSSKN